MVARRSAAQAFFQSFCQGRANTRCQSRQGAAPSPGVAWGQRRPLSNTSGARLETYVIAGPRGSGCICVNGAAAHLIGEGEQVIIIAFEITDKPVEQKVILVDEKNRFVRSLVEKPSTVVA